MAAKKKGAKGKAKKAVKKAGKAKAAKGGAKKAVKKAVKKAAKKPAKKAPAKKKKVSPIPANYPRVITALNMSDARATIEFCKNAFGAKLRMEMSGPDGKLVHSEVQIGDSLLMVMDAVREPVQTAALMVYVKNVDATVESAVAAGATVLNPAADMFWGDRTARLRDRDGNQWLVASHFEDVSPKEMRKRGAAFAAEMAAKASAAAPSPAKPPPLPTSPAAPPAPPAPAGEPSDLVTA